MQSPDTLSLKVYKLLLDIPLGQVTTYKILSQKAEVKNPRQIGQILHKNNHPNRYPCYKVVRSDGSIASGYGAGGPKEQIRRLKKDNVPFKKNKINLKKALYVFKY